jgi:hypothetical protein
MFRGLRQDDTRVIMFPFAEARFDLHDDDDGLNDVALRIGTWNSLNTGAAGTAGPSGKLWYESDFYATFGMGFGGGVSLGTTYTAYNSPNSMFTTVKELAFRLAADDSAYLGRAALKPYALVAFEFDTDLGRGQADAGAGAGRYLELGIAPGYSGAVASIAVPVKLGLSLADYYELNVGTPDDPVFQDNKFGYFSVAGIVTVPIGGTTSLGAWNVHGGLEFQALGDTTKAINGGDGSKIIGSFGVGFSY